VLKLILFGKSAVLELMILDKKTTFDWSRVTNDCKYSIR